MTNPTVISQSAPLFSKEKLFQAVLEAQQSMTAYCVPVRDTHNQLIDFTLCLVNRGFERLVGASKCQIVGQRMTTLFPSINDVGLFEHYKTVVETGQGNSFEFQYQADGYDGWYLISAEPLEEGFVLSFVDITAQKKSQQQAEQQSTLIRNILDASISSIIYMTAIRDETYRIIDFRMVTANQAVMRSNFMRPDQIEGQQLLTIFPGNRDNGFFDLYVRVTETGQPERSVNSYRDNTQLDGWYEVSAVKQDDGVVVTFMNITETKRAQQALEKQSNFLNQVLQTSPMGIIAYEAIRDPKPDGTPGSITDFRSVFFNKAYEQIFETTAQLVESKTFRQRFIEPSDPLLSVNGEALYEFYTRIVNEGESFRREHPYAHMDKWLDVSGTKLGDGFLIVANDITDRKRAELEKQQQTTLVKQANYQLKRSNESLQQFAYIASHDLQEPLRKVQSFSSLLRERYADQLGEGVDLVQRMQGAAERMQTLIRDLLAYSRLSSQAELITPIDLNDLLTGVLSDLETLITAKNAQISLTSLPIISGNETQFRHLFQNLLSNALKFSKPDQSPVVEVHSQFVDRTHLAEPIQSALPDNSDRIWQLQIRDNGIGFDKGYRERIFEVFQRLHGRNSLYTGSGIGLASVKRVIENHLGFIEADSEPGEGSVFTIYLPVS